MDELIEIIRAATRDGATDDQKQAGATACRTLLAALDTRPGQPLGPAMPASPLAMLGRMDVDQVLDLVIAKLRAKLPADEAPRAQTVYRPPPLALPVGKPRP